MKTLLLSICLLLLSYLPSNAEITVTIGSVNAVPGEKVDIPIILTGANGSSALTGVELIIQYDTNSVSVEGGEFIPSCPELPNNGWINNLNYTNNTIILTYLNYTIENVLVPDSTVIGYLEVIYIGTSPSRMTFDTINSMVFNVELDIIEVNFIGGGIITDLGSTEPALITPFDNDSSNYRRTNFLWTKISEAVNYRIQVATNNEFSNLILDELVVENRKNLTNLSINRNYYWRVKALKASDSSDWSRVRTFKTFISPPTLLSPYDNNNGVLLNSTLTWTEDNPNNSYRVQIALTDKFTNLVTNEVVADNQISIANLKVYNNYYWRVCASINNDSSAWSEVWAFTTRSSGPILTNPKNSIFYALNDFPTLTWYSDIRTPESSQLQISLDSTFSQLKVDEAKIRPQYNSRSEYKFYGIENEKNYYWRVRSIYPNDTSDWSEIWRFRSGEVRETPTLIAPEKFANGVSTNYVDFSWYEIENAKYYKFRLYSYSTGESCNITENAYFSAWSLLDGTKYYWSVKAYYENYYNGKNNLDSSDWSEERSFTTGYFHPTVPVLSKPSNNQTQVSLVPQLVWDQSASTVIYRVHVSLNDRFDSQLIADTLVRTTHLKLNNLYPLKKYYWRVKALADTDSTDWSVTWSFTTGATNDVAESNNSIFSISPQPVRNEAVVTFNIENANAGISIELYDLKGTIVATYNFTSLSEGTNKLRLDVSNIPSGMYNAVIKNGAEVHNAKLIKVD